MRGRLVRGVYRLGWRLAGVLPTRPVAGLAVLLARVVVARNGPHVQTLRDNLTRLTGRPASPTLLRSGIVSYLRTFVEVLALPSWSVPEAVGRVRCDDDHALRSAYATTGAVVVLPHSGNWDLAGAWACGTGMPVTTVAEQLGEVEFAAFVAFRERLGMRVLSHRDRDAVPALRDALAQGRLVCLVGDRDLEGGGLEVDWAGEPVTMPGGPALVARRSGAALIPAVCHYGGQPWRRHARMRIVFGTPVAPRPGRSGLVAMTQEVADFFVARLREHPEDWHLMQPFFTRALHPAPPGSALAGPASPAPAGAA